MKKAFTLAEVMIAVAIVAVTSGVIGARTIDFNEKKTLEDAGRYLVSNITNARQSALSGERDATNCANIQLAGWCVSPDTMANTYKKYGVCNDPAVVPPVAVPFPDAASIPDYSLPEGISLITCSKNTTTGVWESTVGNGGRILFQPLGQTVKFANNVTEVMYCLKSGFAIGTSRFYRVRITSSGEIIDEKIQTSCLCL